MIDTSYFIDKLLHFENKEIANKAISLIKSKDMVLTTTIYNTDRAIFELEIHNKTTKQGGIETFGFDEVIKKLKQIKEKEVKVFDYNNSDHLIRIFVNSNDEIIGLFGLKKRHISNEEKYNIMKQMNNIK